MTTKVHGLSCLSTCSSPICVVQFVKRHDVTYWWLKYCSTWDVQSFTGKVMTLPNLSWKGKQRTRLQHTQIQVGWLSQFSNSRSLHSTCARSKFRMIFVGHIVKKQLLVFWGSSHHPVSVHVRLEKTFYCKCYPTCFMYRHTLSETNMAPENWWLEDDPFLLAQPCFQVQAVSFREGKVYFVPYSTCHHC